MTPRVLTLALAALMALPSPALALSCLRPDSVRLYEFARDSEDLYQIVLGRLVSLAPINRPEPPEVGEDPFPEGETNITTTRVRIVGMALTEKSFNQPFDEAVTLELGCLGLWCSDPPTQEKELLFAIRIEDGARFLNPGVCSETVVLGTAGGVIRLLDCHSFGHCPQQF